MPSIPQCYGFILRTKKSSLPRTNQITKLTKLISSILTTACSESDYYSIQDKCGYNLSSKQLTYAEKSLPLKIVPPSTSVTYWMKTTFLERQTVQNIIPKLGMYSQNI